MKSSILWIALASALHGCGGDVSLGHVPGDGGTNDGMSSSEAGISGGGSGGSPVGSFGTSDAQPDLDSTACNLAVGSWASADAGPSDCAVHETEICVDGNTYTVDCSCPGNMPPTCSCSASGTSGKSSSVVPDSGCQICGFAAALMACGFPSEIPGPDF